WGYTIRCRNFSYPNRAVCDIIEHAEDFPDYNSLSFLNSCLYIRFYLFPEHTIVATPDMVGLQYESGLDESISKYLKPDFAKKIK
ncbi:MAG: hypothetical protein NTU90_02630, partial [Proteobacteria bacterium]|nr:hypothetical protein [Pseudomonadota bacterium]